MANAPIPFGSAPIAPIPFDSKPIASVAPIAAPAPPSKLSADIQTAGNGINDGISGEGEFQGQTPLERGIAATATAARAVPTVGADLVPGGSTILAALAKLIGGAVQAPGHVGSILADASQALGLMTPEQRAAYDEHNAQFAESPAAADISRVATVGKNLGDIAGTVLGGDQGAGVADSAVSATHTGITGLLQSKIADIPDAPSAGPTGPLKEGTDLAAKTGIAPPAPDLATQAESATKPGGLVDQVKANLAKGNIDPRLAASAARLDDPVGAYSTYAKQAEAAKTDVTADPPIAAVGEHIGKAFDNVIQMRRTVGAQMADELTKVKDVPVDISTPVTNWQNDLAENASEGASKMTSFEHSQLDTYSKELAKLGSNPTAAQVDAFLGRVPRELDQASAATNITDVTNADRLIKRNLADLRSSLTKTPGLTAYSAARNAYSELSNFLDEGSSYLGAKTQSGDYTRDTSIAKSSAESILNGGKKDWLLKLQGLTGYKALDDTTLAIQAMKDVGDNRGLSLFKTLGDGGIPTPHGLVGKMLGFAVDKAAGAAVGSPVEQTTAFLKGIKASAPK